MWPDDLVQIATAPAGSGVALVKGKPPLLHPGTAIMSTSAFTTYAGRGSVHRAAKKAHGAGNYRVELQKDGRYAFFSIDGNLPPPRIEPQTAPAIDDHPPGLKRLRAAKDAERIREATLADQTAGRRAAAGRIATGAEPVDLPDFLKRHDTADAGTQATGARAAADMPQALTQPAPEPATRAAAKAKPRRRMAPKEGTKTRLIFDMLCRHEGATAKEIAAAGVAGVSVRAYATDFENAFPRLTAICEKDGATDRCRLLPKALRPAAAARPRAVGFAASRSCRSATRTSQARRSN